MMIPKTKPWRSKKYTDWVKTLSCVNCFAPADEAHHITGMNSGMGAKNSDITCIPMCRGCHTLLHSGNLSLDEPEELSRIIMIASNDGIIGVKNE